LAEGIDLQYPFYYYYNYPIYTPFSFNALNQINNSTTSNNSSNYYKTYHAINKGFGGGTNFYVSAGYNFTKNISAEIGFSYLSGTTLQSTYSSTNTDYESTYDTTTEYQSFTNKLQSSARYRLMPSIKFSVPISKFTPYMKAGLLIGLGGTLTLSNEYSESEIALQYNSVYFSSETANTGLTATGGLSLGYTGSVGLEYAFADFFSIYCEATIVKENWSPAKGDITQYSVSGVTPSYALSSSQFTYSDNITTAGSTQPSANTNNVIQVNSQYPKQTFSFGSYGISLGIKLSIPSKAPTPKVPDSYVAPKAQ
jgi:hypothetical protein